MKCMRHLLFRQQHLFLPVHSVCAACFHQENTTVQYMVVVCCCYAHTESRLAQTSRNHTVAVKYSCISLTHAYPLSVLLGLGAVQYDKLALWGIKSQMPFIIYDGGRLCTIEDALHCDTKLHTELNRLTILQHLFRH